MAGLSFSVFKDKIISGSKRQTIRGIRKNPIKEGETLYMWWKQRSPQREKLGEATCIKVSKIDIETRFIRLNDELINDIDSLDKVAIADGFDNWFCMMEWFADTHGLPFTGVLIEWDDIVRDVDPELVKALNEWSGLVEDTCPCGQMGKLDCAGECGYEYSDEDCHECGGTGHHEESIHMPCSSCLGNRKQRY